MYGKMNIPLESILNGLHFVILIRAIARTTNTIGGFKLSYIMLCREDKVLVATGRFGLMPTPIKSL